MKKSSIKYLGVTAAALLAVAPIAAPAAVASIAPQTVSAAEADDVLAQAKAVATNIQNANADTTKADTITAALGQTLTGWTAVSASPMYTTVKNPNWTWASGVTPDDTKYSYTFTAGSGLTSDDFKAKVANAQTNKESVTLPVTLTVADVATKTTVASNTVQVTFNFKASDSDSMKNLTSTFPDTTAKSGDSLDKYNITANVTPDVSLTDAKGAKVAFKAVSAAVTDKDGKAVTGVFPAGAGVYTQTYTFTVSGYKKGDVVTLKNNGTDVTPAPSVSDDGVATMSITRKINVYDATSKSQPFFTWNGATLANGATLSLTSAQTPTANVGDAESAAETALQGVVDATKLQGFASSDDKTAVAATDLNYKDGLKSVSALDKDGKLIAGNYVVPVSYTNPTSGKTATVKVPFTVKSATEVANSPVFTVDGTRVSTSSYLYPTEVKVGDAFDLSKIVTAVQSADNSSAIPFTSMTVDGKVDTSKAGTYTVKVSATNSNGYTTTMNLIVVVSGDEGSVTNETGTVYVNYVPGYGIAVWNTYKDGRKITGTKLQHATAWKYYKTATINGEKWYNLGGDQWIEAKYTSATKPGNAGSEIEKINGTVKVNYVPGYGIAIWGKPAADVTSKKLAHGTTWKVFAKTSVNGTTWYNLGGNQWVDGTYAKLQ